jgi:hypothetical protein
MGARAEYSRWGGIYRSHIDKSQQVLRTFKMSGDFFDVWNAGSAVPNRDLHAENHRAAGRFAEFAADLSDAIAGD